MTDDKSLNNDCNSHVRAVNDAMYVLSGKWKITVLTSLCFNETRRFTDLLNDVQGISNKMLSKELKELETNKLVLRTVLTTQPITVKYQLTDHGKKLTSVIRNLSDWGKIHRKEIIEHS